MLCIHPMQSYLNMYIFSYISICIYAMHASYAAINKLVYIYSYMSLCYECILCSCIYIYLLWHACNLKRPQTSNHHAIPLAPNWMQSVYKIVFVFLYKSMHLCNACMHPMPPYKNLYIFSYINLCFTSILCSRILSFIYSYISPLCINLCYIWILYVYGIYILWYKRLHILWI